MRIPPHAALLLPLALIACGRGSDAPARQAPPSSAPADPIEAARCEQTGLTGRCTLYGASIIELIARPAAYHGKRVRVIGYVELEFEGNGIYLSHDAWARIPRNGIWLEPPDGRALPPGAFTPRYMILEGTFDAESSGHMGLWSGGIEKITRFEPWDVDLDVLPPEPLPDT